MWISVHPSGRYVFAANYGSGTVGVLPVKSNGELAPASDIRQDKGTLGPLHASSAPPGSFAISGHDAPHAHMVHADPSGKRVLSTDLGLALPDFSTGLRQFHRQFLKGYPQQIRSYQQAGAAGLGGMVGAGRHAGQEGRQGKHGV